MSFNRQVWSNPQILQRQKSTLDCFPVTNNNRTQRILRKQLSTDLGINCGKLSAPINVFGHTSRDNQLSDGKPEASLKIFKVAKKRTQINVEIDEQKTERSKKVPPIKQDSKNLSIFLSQNLTISDCGDYPSDAETQFEIKVGPPKSNEINNLPTESKRINDRRAEFQMYRSQTFDKQRKTVVRVMSAPIRTNSFDAETRIIQQKTKRLRRRRNGRDDQTDGDSIEETNDLLTTKAKIGTKKTSRTNSLAPCDIVTLVSLLSSGGSDSEREDVTAMDGSTRAPMLQKNGKSVSFQESDEYQTTKEFPVMLRRGSIAPLAAKIRANRPPTAPPGSIYLCDFDESEMPSTKLRTTKNVSQTMLKRSDTIDSTVDYTYPEYVKTDKERDCWVLFQKMSQKGVTVTYDTILRGMLTPTELRALNKQKNVFEKQNSIDVQEENGVPIHY